MGGKILQVLQHESLRGFVGKWDSLISSSAGFLQHRGLPKLPQGLLWGLCSADMRQPWLLHTDLCIPTQHYLGQKGAG